MVLPLIPIVAAFTGFVMWGKNMLNEKTYNQIIKGSIVIISLLILYLGYKAYKAWQDAKDAAEDAVETVKDAAEDAWTWVLEGTDTGKDLIDDTVENITNWSEESKEARKQAVEKLDPYLGIKSGISENSLEAKQYAAGQAVRQKIIDVYNAPTWAITSVRDKLKFW